MGVNRDAKAFDRNGNVVLEEIEKNIFKICDLLPHEIMLIYTTYATTVIYAHDPQKNILVCDTSEHSSFEAINLIFERIGNQPYFIPYSGNCNPLQKVWSKEHHHLYPKNFKEQVFTFFLIFKHFNSEKRFLQMFPKVMLTEIVKFLSYVAF